MKSCKTSSNKSWKLLCFSAFIVLAFTGFASFAAETDKAGTSFAFSELGQKATEKADSNSLGIKAVDNVAKIICKLQALEASVTPSGISIKSTSSTEGGGTFSMKVAGLGSIGHRLSQVSPEGKVKVSKDCVQIIYPELIEEYTVSGDGIRQDFIISKKPEGNGNLSLSIGLTGATAELSNSGLKIRLTETGREFSYSKLLVTDATGKTLPAEFKTNSPDEFYISVDDSSAIYPVRIDPTISDANWVSMGRAPGIVGTVYALTYDRFGNLYVGGDLTRADGVTVNRVAKWNGTEWTALGSGMNGTVSSLTCDSSGNIYAGGNFTTAGGVPANHIAKWNGMAWIPLGTGMNATVDSLACNSSGNIFAGGYFTTAGGVLANYIAKWNGSAWSPLGTGMDGAVCALDFDSSGKLYAGGSFSTAGGVSANNIAKWNGYSWSQLDSGTDGFVLSLACDSSGNLYAGGSITTAGGISANNIAKWNGSSWSQLDSGMNNIVFSLACDSSGNLYAGGAFTTAGGVSANSIAKWNGSTWNPLGLGIEKYSEVRAIVLGSSENLFVGGNFPAAGGITATAVANWNGSAWSPLILDKWVNSTVYSLSCDSYGNLYAGGEFTKAGGVSVNYIAKWNGTDWSSLGSGMDGIVNAITFDSSGTLYAGGVFTTADGVTVNHIAKWNGLTWSALGSGTDQSVLALTFDSSGNLYAGGYFTTAGGVSANYIAKWNGTVWSSLGSGITGYGFVEALICDSSGSLYVGGDFTTPGVLGVQASNIAKWNGTTWSAIGSGLGWGVDDPVHALAFDSSGNLYVGGDFDTAGGISANHIAKWNGTAWSALGSGMNGIVVEVDSLSCDSTGPLYVGGYFTTAGGKTANNVAKWNGTAWSALGSGTDGTVRALVCNPSGNLYVGGGFSTAGGKFSENLAKILISPPVLSYGYLSNGSISGNTPQNVNYGADASAVIATPNADYHFANWTGIGGLSSTDNPLIVENVRQDMYITANFAHNTETISVNKIGLGAVTGSGTFDTQTTNHTITATPDTDYAFINWTISGDGMIADANSATTDVTLTSPRHGTTFTATANFFNATTNTLSSGDNTPLLTDSKTGMKVYKINVPDGNQKYLTATLTGVTVPGDCDLYARLEKIPSLQTYDYRSTKVAGNNETITIQYPAAGDWYFMIYAYDDYSGVTFSASYGTDFPDKPTNLDAVISGDKTKVNLSWDTVPGADSYNLYRSTINSSENAVKLNSDPILDVTFADTFMGTYYYYFVTTVDAGKESGFSDPATADPVADTIIKTLTNGVAVTGISGSIGETKTYSINIPDKFQTLLEIKISGVTGDCDIDVIDPNGNTVKRGVKGSSNEIVQISGNPLADGNWLIRLYGVTDYSGLTLTAKCSKQIIFPAVPAGVNASDGLFDDKIVVTWTATAGATGYMVGRKNNLMDANFAEEFETTDNIFEDNSKAVLDADAGKLFYYSVKAKNAVDYGKYSAANSGYRTKAPSVLASVTASDGTYFDRIHVTWAKVAGATSYMVYRTESLTPVPAIGTNTPIGETSALFLDDYGNKLLPSVDGNGVLVVKNYYYWIAAKNQNGSTLVSRSNTGYLSKKGPATITASNGTYSNKITVTWAAVPGATAYDVYRYTDSKFSKDESKVKSAVASLEYDDNPPTADIPYYYKVKAKYGINYDSTMSLAGAVGRKSSTGSSLVPDEIASSSTSLSTDGTKGSLTYFYTDVPMGTARLVATVNGIILPPAGANDCDLFAKFANYPTKASYGAKGVENATSEILTVSNPAPGAWYFLLYGTTAYTNVTLTVNCYKMTDIVLKQVPSNDLAVPFTAVFKGQVLDDNNTAIPNIVLQARNPITGLTTFLTKTDAKGFFSYSALINSEGEHTFDFFFNEMPDTAKGTASHTVATRKNCLADGYFDISCYLPAAPVEISDHSIIQGLQNFLDTRNGWDEDDIVNDYATKWVENTLAKANDDAKLAAKLDEGLHMFFYGVEGAGIGNDTTNKSALSAVPFVVHVEGTKKPGVLTNLKSLGILDDAQKDELGADKVGIIAIASLSNPEEASDDNYNISLLACEQLELLANIAAGEAIFVEDGKYSDTLTKTFTVTLSNGRKINVVATVFVK